MHGGIKIYRGSAVAARNYVEADRPRADDYYLAEGTGLAEHLIATTVPWESGSKVSSAGSLDGDAYEAWVAGLDTGGRPKGRVRTDEQAVRFVEVVVNGPKTWSLAAAVHPEIAAAYDAAQDRAASEVIGWLAEHATTRVGPRGRQVQVPVEQLEAAVVRHYTSRAGDPHRHLHLQINARVWAAGRWRGIHTVGVRDSIEAINGIGHAAVACDPEFRATVARLGYTFDPATGEIRELTGYAAEFSARAAQIDRNVSRFEAEWRAAHPGEEPGPRIRQAWDTRAWAQARPDKVVPHDGAELIDRWAGELADLGFTPPTPTEASEAPPVPSVLAKAGRFDRDEVVEAVVARLGARRSAWNAADIRGEVEQAIATAGVVATSAVRVELAEDLTSRALDACVPLLVRADVPEHVRGLTSPHVLAVEADLTTRLTTRTESPVQPATVRDQADASGNLDAGQREAVAALAGHGELLVIEGAAGAGKTTTLAAARHELETRGHRLVVVTPTRKASQVAARELGTAAFSAAWLAHQYGFRWDDDGHYIREPLLAGGGRESARLQAGDVLLVDEAGMLDQDTALALTQVADETGARLVFMGDRHQLPAVGRGGVLDLAARWTPPEAVITLGAVHRFTDPAYAELSLLMRSGERSGEVFDHLYARGEIQIHPTAVEQNQALANTQANIQAGTQRAVSDGGGESRLLVADTRLQVDLLNRLVRDQRVTAGEVDDQHVVRTAGGGRLGAGDWVVTLRNDRDLDVANRETWTITHIDPDTRDVRVAGRGGERSLPAAYARTHLALGYATTAYGAQGETVEHADLAVTENTAAASAYVAMTRGRTGNTAHLVADDVEDARRQWTAIFSRDRADLGPAHAATQALSDIDRYGPALIQAAALQHGQQPVQRPGSTAPATDAPPRAPARDRSPS
jgi:exodeoxyribonuclease V alpha subunit